jgi:hypothetical protein
MTGRWAMAIILNYPQQLGNVHMASLIDTWLPTLLLLVESRRFAPQLLHKLQISLGSVVPTVVQRVHGQDKKILDITGSGIILDIT